MAHSYQNEGIKMMQVLLQDWENKLETHAKGKKIKDIIAEWLLFLVLQNFVHPLQFFFPFIYCKTCRDKIPDVTVLKFSLEKG